MVHIKIKNIKLAKIMLSGKNHGVSYLTNFLSESFLVKLEHRTSLANKISKDFSYTFKKRWIGSSRTTERFLAKNDFWLNECYFEWSDPNLPIPTPSDIVGRPKINFEASSERSKRRKTELLYATHSQKELQFALEHSLRTSGHKNIADKLHALMLSIDSDDSINERQPVKCLSKEEALALYFDAKLTKFQYNRIRSESIKKDSCIFPTYKNILEAKKECYPSITISDRGASINLQCLLDYTVSRLFSSLDKSGNLPTKKDLVLISKWGCDGSSGHSNYKQNFDNPEDSDESLFMMSLVPLQLIHSLSTNDTPCWINPHPSSTKLCRPIKFEFAKETSTKITEEINIIKNDIEKLSPTKVQIQRKRFTIKHSLHLTMLDGKVHQVMTGTPSAASCYICGAKPSEMNNLNLVRNKCIQEGSVEYGLSTLHAWIRFMECILHISYRLKFKKWSARRPEEKIIMEESKKRIQLMLKQNLGITVDVPRQGSGTSNDGNTARRFFRNWKTVAEITEVNEELIYKFFIILQVLSCGSSVDPSKFQSFSLETAKIFIREYGWYFMPSSVHKILIHGNDVLNATILPIGQMSEEAQESRNKDFKRFRQFNTRKSSRFSTNEDIMHNLLITSDPLISILRSQWPTTVLELEKDAKYLLSNYEDVVDVEED